MSGGQLNIEESTIQTAAQAFADEVEVGLPLNEFLDEAQALQFATQLTAQAAPHLARIMKAKAEALLEQHNQAASKAMQVITQQPNWLPRDIYQIFRDQYLWAEKQLRPFTETLDVTAQHVEAFCRQLELLLQDRGYSLFQRGDVISSIKTAIYHGEKELLREQA